MMVPSWILVPAPMRMKFVSPRSTQWYQTLLPAPIVTSPMTAAVGATQAVGVHRRDLALEGIERRRDARSFGRSRQPRLDRDAEHQADVLHRRA